LRKFGPKECGVAPTAFCIIDRVEIAAFYLSRSINIYLPHPHNTPDSFSAPIVLKRSISRTNEATLDLSCD